MIDKRFVMYGEIIQTLCSVKFVGEKNVVFLYCHMFTKSMCCRWVAGVTGNEWSKYESSGFRTYLEAEEWLKKKGYL